MLGSLFLTLPTRTLTGQIGFADRSGYTAIGTVCNLAARLCDEAHFARVALISVAGLGVPGYVRVKELCAAAPLRNQKFADSPLEGEGFELQVPLGRNVASR